MALAFDAPLEDAPEHGAVVDDEHAKGVRRCRQLGSGRDGAFSG